MDNNRRCCRDCESLLKKIRTYDFAINEVVLYLDAYPKNCRALDYYHKLVGKREALVAEYETKCGPLTYFGNREKCSWSWVDSPWPWDYDAN